MINISYKKLIKRLLAYMIDIIIIIIISTLITNIPIFNKHFNHYQTIYEEYKAIYEEYTATKILLNDSYKDEEITEEEYTQLLTKETYSTLFIESYSDNIIDSSEFNTITTSIDSLYNSLAKDYNYKLSKTSIYNSIVTIISTFIYFAILPYFLKGATLGKKIMSLKVVSSHDKQLTIFTYILRCLIINNVFLDIVDIIFLSYTTQSIFNTADNIISILITIIEAITVFLVMTREDNRGLHDLLCQTKVISTKD